jgi:hypothetical protein
MQERKGQYRILSCDILQRFGCNTSTKKENKRTPATSLEGMQQYATTTQNTNNLLCELLLDSHHGRAIGTNWAALIALWSGHK